MRLWIFRLLIGLLIAAGAYGVWRVSPYAAAPQTAGVAQTQQVGDLRVTLTLDQALPGNRVADVQVLDSAGSPAAVDAVRLRFSMQDATTGFICDLMTTPGAGISEAEAQQIAPGHFQARGPFFTMVGRWVVHATLTRTGQAATDTPFTLAVAAPGEAGGPLNPVMANPQTLAAGQALYTAQCATCHGTSGQGDGPLATGLNPRPANFTRHMSTGLHTDGQVYLWIHDGFAGSAMPAWKERLSDEQIWQLVTYLRTFAQVTPTSTPQPTAQPEVALSLAATVTAVPLLDASTATSDTLGIGQPFTTGQNPQFAPVPDVSEPLPPLVFERDDNLWRSDGHGGAPQQLTQLHDTYVQDLALAPDGRTIAYVVMMPAPYTATVPLPTSALWLMQSDGTNPRVLWQPPTGRFGLATWTPDGQALYIAADGLPAPKGTKQNQFSQIVRVDAATGAHQTALADALDPVLSADGTQLAYLKVDSSGYGALTLHIAAPDGSGDRALVTDEAFADFYAPRFSPDGKTVVFTAVGGPETDNAGNPIKASVPSLLQGVMALFAPATAEAHGSPWDVWSIHTDGSGLRRLTFMYEDMPMITFSPDGKEMVMLAAGGFYRMDADGKYLRRIDRIGNHGGLAWAP